MKKLNENVIKDKTEFRKRGNELWIRREEQGDGCMYSELQPRVWPIIDQNFVAQRIDVLYLFDILDGDGKEPKQGLRWCQGEVTKVFKDKKKPTVEILWDEIEESIDTVSRSNVVLHNRKWNKNCEGTWRMGVTNTNMDMEDNSLTQ